MTNSVIDTIAVGDAPHGINFTPDGSKIYVSNAWEDTVSVIDVATNSVVNTISVGDNPIGISFDPDGSRCFVANALENTVNIIDTDLEIVIGTITVGNGPVAFGNFISPYEQPLSITSYVNESDILIYPNPSNGKFTIENNLLISFKLEIYDTVGKCIYTTDLSSSKTTIDLSPMSKGIYLLKINSEKGILNKKIIIQ